MEIKRKRMKADERRQEIIRAAMEVFARNGFQLVKSPKMPGLVRP